MTSPRLLPNSARQGATQNVKQKKPMPKTTAWNKSPTPSTFQP